VKEFRFYPVGDRRQQRFAVIFGFHVCLFIAILEFELGALPLQVALYHFSHNLSPTLKLLKARKEHKIRAMLQDSNCTKCRLE
jgi:hypothetical protein